MNKAVSIIKKIKQKRVDERQGVFELKALTATLDLGQLRNLLAIATKQGMDEAHIAIIVSTIERIIAAMEAEIQQAKDDLAFPMAPQVP